MLEFEMNCWVTVVACAGCSCVSPCTSVILVLLAALSMDTASSAKCSCSVPSGATGPVIGASIPIEAVHVLVLLLLDPPPAAAVLELLLLLLLLPQPATTSEPTAAATRTRRPFIGYASISRVISQCGWVAALARAPVPRHAFEEAQRNALPLAEFVSLIKPLPFRPRQEDYSVTGLAVVNSIPTRRSHRWPKCSAQAWTSPRSGLALPRFGRVSPSSTPRAARRCPTRWATRSRSRSGRPAPIWARRTPPACASGRSWPKPRTRRPG